MVRLRALAEHRLLGFDEIADLRLFAEYRPGAQQSEGADLAAPADRRSFDMAVGANLHAVRDGHPGTQKDIDRKGVVSGKSVSVRVELGGRRTVQKKESNMQLVCSI